MVEKRLAMVLLLLGTFRPWAQETPPAQAPVPLPVDSAAEEPDVPEAAAEEAYVEPPPPLFLESYTEGAYSRHEQDNTSGFSNIKVGKRFDLGRPVDVYAKARMHRDARDFFWNNHLDAGIGARVNLLKRAALSVYVEALTGLYYRTSAGTGDLAGIQARLDRTHDALADAQAGLEGLQFDVFRRVVEGDTALTRKELDDLEKALAAQGRTLEGVVARLDSLETTRDSLRQAGDSLALIPAGPLTEYRAGFMFWYGTGLESPVDGGLAFPLRFWCDLYADGTFSALRRTVRTRKGGETYRDSTARFNNLILYLNPDVGAVLVDGPGGSVAAYGTLYAWLDTHADWWNNRAMAGPGIRHKPFRDLDLVLAFEYLWGAYYGRERDEDPNPYARTFTDARLMATFWYGLGF